MVDRILADALLVLHLGFIIFADGCIGTLLLPIVYPRGLTRSLQIGLGMGVLLLNGIGYGLLLWRRRTQRRLP